MGAEVHRLLVIQVSFAHQVGPRFNWRKDNLQYKAIRHPFNAWNLGVWQLLKKSPNCAEMILSLDIPVMNIHLPASTVVVFLSDRNHHTQLRRISTPLNFWRLMVSALHTSLQARHFFKSFTSAKKQIIPSNKATLILICTILLIQIKLLEGLWRRVDLKGHNLRDTTLNSLKNL